MKNILNTETAEVTSPKRAYCLYRVSTKKQVDKLKDDIPMQKIACHEFAEEKNWLIAKEFYEKGISGFKVSANDRDTIQELKEAALNHEFDVLLVYMFDRLGRRDDETPFVVEWFVKQGIEVWSTQEGEQRFENQTDKLLNYIRYWQANGESTKTSMRLKTRMAQLTAEGIYHGGATPLGYKAVHRGRMNKKGQPVKDLEIDPQEAEYVKMIFSKTLNEGYGSFRMADYLNRLGIRTHGGKEFQCNTINRILKNKLYCGYYVAGETTSPKLEHLVIIDENVFDEVQHILKQRSKKNDEKQHIARTTKGKTLLAGNLYCAHCGGRLASTEGKDKYIRKDGTVAEQTYLRYICYHKARKLNNCDGQSVYSANRVDEIVLAVVEQYLDAIKKTPKDKALEIRYKKELAEKRKVKRELSDKKERLEKRLTELSLEVGKSLCGENRFPVDVLSMSINSTKAEMAEVDRQLSECDTALEKQSDVLNKLDFYYQQFVTWANEFENASPEQRKMIICQLISSIKVGRGYNIEIEFNTSYRQFFNDDLLEEKIV
jgi:DNA invertase Pin-like site-specific DNA recombinase